jgi:hypothetical protein
MKKTLMLLPMLFGALASCGSTKKHAELEGRANMWAGDAIKNASLNNAIISQHTLYPYHFVSSSAELNDLGLRDLNVLSDHFTKTPGDLNVRRGDASQSLYEARVKTVLDRLAEVGVQGGSVAVKDEMPGGEGISSERVIVILKGKMTSPGSTMDGGTSAVTGSGVLVQ